MGQAFQTLVISQRGAGVAQITMAGLEVDAVEPVAAQFSGVVVGEVLETEQSI